MEGKFVTSAAVSATVTVPSSAVYGIDSLAEFVTVDSVGDSSAFSAPPFLASVPSVCASPVFSVPSCAISRRVAPTATVTSSPHADDFAPPPMLFPLEPAPSPPLCPPSPSPSVASASRPLGDVDDLLTHRSDPRVRAWDVLSRLVPESLSQCMNPTNLLDSLIPSVLQRPSPPQRWSSLAGKTMQVFGSLLANPNVRLTQGLLPMSHFTRNFTPYRVPDNPFGFASSSLPGVRSIPSGSSAVDSTLRGASLLELERRSLDITHLGNFLHLLSLAFSNLHSFQEWDEQQGADATLLCEALYLATNDLLVTALAQQSNFHLLRRQALLQRTAFDEQLRDICLRSPFSSVSIFPETLQKQIEEYLESVRKTPRRQPALHRQFQSTPRPYTVPSRGQRPAARRGEAPRRSRGLGRGHRRPFDGSSAKKPQQSS